MANTLLTTTKILDRAMAVLFQAPTFLDKINVQYSDHFFGKGVGPYGDTGYIKVPPRAVIRDGRVMQIQNQVETTVPISINKYKGVDTGATSLEMALDIDDYQEQFIDTKIPDLVAAVEADVLSTVVPLVYHSAGDYGLYNDVSTVLAAGGILSNNLAPINETRYMLTNTTAQQQIVNALTGFYNPQTTISDQFKSGLMARNTLGFDWYQTTLMPSLTRGSANTAYETATGGANMNAAGTSIDIDTGSGTFAVGDIFTIEGVNDVHPQTKANLGYLKQFVVTTASAGGTVTLSFTPAIVVSGPGQNVSNTPGADKDVLPLGTASTAYQQNLAFTKDAFYFATVDLPMPTGMGVSCAQRTWKGITMRFMNGFDIANDMFVSRFDIAYGAGILRQELAVRVPNIPA
jgi:hypothetical protein